MIDLAVPASGPDTATNGVSCTEVALDAPLAPERPIMESTGAFLWDDALHLYAPSADRGQLRHWWRAPPSLAGQFDHDYFVLGVAGRPATISFPLQDHIFARSTNGLLLHMWFDDVPYRWFRDIWSDNLSGDPTALGEGTNQNVWAVNNTGELVRIWWNSDSGIRSSEVWGRHALGRPSATIVTGIVYLVARLSSGAIGYWRSDGGQPSLLASFGDGITGDPVIAIVDGVVRVWAVDGQQRLWHWWSGEGHPWQGEVWGGGVVGRPSVVLAGQVPRVFTRSADGVIERWSEDNSGRARRDRIGDRAITDPTAIWFYGQEHVFANTEGDLVKHWWSTTTCELRYELLAQQ